MVQVIIKNQVSLVIRYLFQALDQTVELFGGFCFFSTQFRKVLCRNLSQSQCLFDDIASYTMNVFDRLTNVALPNLRCSLSNAIKRLVCPVFRIAQAL